jgi:hypothetical protein
MIWMKSLLLHWWSRGGERSFFFAGDREGLRQSERDMSEAGRAAGLANKLQMSEEGRGEWEILGILPWSSRLGELGRD